jgi:AcrR family transcriptional regulator
MGMKIKQSPKLPAEKRRHQLLQAAHQLFASKGYRESSTDDIARKAGLTKGAFYFHFKSKEEVLLTLMRRQAEGFRQMLIEKVDHLSGPGDLLRVMLRECPFESSREFRSMVDIWAQAMRVSRIRRYFSQTHRESTKYLVDRIAARTGWDRKELYHSIVLTLSLADGLAAHRAMDPRLVNVNAQLRLFRSMSETWLARSKKRAKK